MGNIFSKFYNKLLGGLSKILQKFEKLMFWRQKGKDKFAKTKRDFKNFQETGEIPDEYEPDPRERIRKKVEAMRNRKYTIVKEPTMADNREERFKEFYEKYKEKLNFSMDRRIKTFIFRSYERWGCAIPDDYVLRRATSGVPWDGYVTWEEREEMYYRWLHNIPLEYTKLENTMSISKNILKVMWNVLTSGQVMKPKPYQRILSDDEEKAVDEMTFDYEDARVLYHQNTKEEIPIIKIEKEQVKTNEKRTSRTK